MVITKKYELVAGVRTLINVSDTSVTGHSVILYNETHGNHFLAVGDSTVTTANGIHLYGGEKLQLKLEPSDKLYVIASEAIDLRVLAYNVD